MSESESEKRGGVCTSLLASNSLRSKLISSDKGKASKLLMRVKPSDETALNLIRGESI